MDYDPFTGEQIKFLRRCPGYRPPVSGPWNYVQSVAWLETAAGIGAVIILLFLAAAYAW